MDNTTPKPTELDRELVSRAQAVITELLEHVRDVAGKNVSLISGIYYRQEGSRFLCADMADVWSLSLADALAPKCKEAIRAEKLAEAERLEAKAAKLREEAK